MGVSAALLIGAHLFERVGGLAPCLLCLDQREAHWAAFGAAAATMLAAKAFQERIMLVAALGALMLIYLFSAGLAGFHAGVEWGFWDGPAACAATGAGAPVLDISGEDILSSLSQAGPSGPSCEEAPWRLMGMSMAGYNALASLGLALIVGMGFRDAWRQNQDQGPFVIGQTS